MRKAWLPILLAGLWITAFEFVRNELLLKRYWVDHFHRLGLNFKTLPVNGVLWMAWSVISACVIYRLLQKYSFLESLFLAWLVSFAMMWIVTYNLQVLPLKLLLFAVPMSMLETTVAGLIIRGTTPQPPVK